MTKRLSLQQFYAERFNSDPYSLLDYFNPEISNVAAEAFVDWQSIAGSIQLNDKKYRGKIGILPGGSKGKVAVYGQIKSTPSGIDYPHINFNSKQNGGFVVTFDGYKELFELYKREAGNEWDKSKKSDWQKAQEAKRAERLRKQAEVEAAEARERELRQCERNAYELAFERNTSATFEKFYKGRLTQSAVEFLADEDGSFPYLQRKKISDVAQHCEMKRMRDQGGEFTAIKLTDIDGNFCGLQRLYDNKKLQTVSVVDGQFSGAHFTIGNIQPNGKAFIVEGFATGASVWMATQVPVIVAISADNLKKVIAQYRRVYPDLTITNAADNDCWKPEVGNKGLMTALEIHKDHNIRATYPRWSEMTDEELATKPTDWNDLHVLRGISEVARTIRSHDNKLKARDKYFDYCLQRLQFVGSKSATEEALKAANAGMMLFPIVYERKEVAELVLGALPHGMSIDGFKLKRRITWLAMLKANKARALRSFTHEALNKAHVNYIKVDAVPGEHNNMVLPKSIIDLVNSLDGSVIVRAPMGYGKTERLIKPLMDAAPRGAYVAHRISLIGDAAKRLGISNYQDMLAFEVPHTNHIACCVNSIVNPKFQNANGLSWFETAGLLCIDEASQVVRHTTGGPVDNPVKVMDGLVNAMRSAQKVVLCDADANDSLIHWCEMARPGETIHIIEVEDTEKDIEILHTDVDTAFYRAVSMVKEGRKVLVADDGANDGEKLVEEILNQCPDTKILQVRKEHKANEQVKQFLSDPNKYCVDYDVIIYSPAISSGVSITTKHFDAHVSIFHGTVTPSDCVQMMRRDRTAKRYIVGIGILNTQRETDREAIFRGLLAADEMASADFEETEDEIRLRHKKTIFDELYLECQANENMARNDFANNLLLILGGGGYKVSRLAAGHQEKEVGKAMKEAAGEVVKARRINLIMSQETPNDETFQRLSSDEDRTLEEDAQIHRYHMENQLCVNEIDEETIKFYDDQGIKKVQQLELLQATEDQAVDYDHMQLKNKVVMTRHKHKRATRAILKQVFETLGICPETGSGEFKVQQCREVMRQLLSNSKSIDMYNTLRVGAYVNPKSLPKDATTFVKNILLKMGLTVHKRKSHGSNVLSISAASWMKVNEYIELRKQKGVHSLKVEATATPEAVTAKNDQKEPQAAPAVALSGGTLAQGGIHVDVNYPREKEIDQAKVYRIVTEAIADLSIDPETAIGWLGKQDFEDIDRGELTVSQLNYYFRVRARSQLSA